MILSQLMLFCSIAIASATGKLVYAIVLRYYGRYWCSLMFYMQLLSCFPPGELLLNFPLTRAYCCHGDPWQEQR